MTRFIISILSDYLQLLQAIPLILRFVIMTMEIYNSYQINGLVSFDLKSLQKAAADSVILHVKANEFDSNFYEHYFTYKY